MAAIRCTVSSGSMRSTEIPEADSASSTGGIVNPRRLWWSRVRGPFVGSRQVAFANSPTLQRRDRRFGEVGVARNPHRERLAD